MQIILGKVIRGIGYGRRLGFPTANMERRNFSRLKKKPRLGIYAGFATLEEETKKHRAAIVIGPLDTKKLPKLEAYLLDFNGSLYGKCLTITLLKFLRPFKVFESESALKEAIRRDVRKTRRLITDQVLN